jgi:hypothetical protein
VLVTDNDTGQGLRLKSDPGSSPWCDASFEGEKYQVVEPGMIKKIIDAWTRADTFAETQVRIAGQIEFQHPCGPG